VPLAIRDFGVGDFEIRDFLPADLDTLWRIDQECFPPGISYSRNELRHYLRRQGAFGLVAWATRKLDRHDPRKTAVPRIELTQSADNSPSSVAGFIVTEVEHGKGHVITIDVVAAARRHGVGSLLICGAEERLRGSGYSLVELETAVDNLSALAFYKRHGYVVVESLPRYYSNGVDALLLQKPLAASKAQD
jgi:[ribosomal protein S18]-alanine N-acetyltransferase